MDLTVANKGILRKTYKTASIITQAESQNKYC